MALIGTAEGVRCRRHQVNAASNGPFQRLHNIFSSISEAAQPSRTCRHRPLLSHRPRTARSSRRSSRCSNFQVHRPLLTAVVAQVPQFRSGRMHGRRGRSLLQVYPAPLPVSPGLIPLFRCSRYNAPIRGPATAPVSVPVSIEGRLASCGWGSHPERAPARPILRGVDGFPNRSASFGSLGWTAKSVRSVWRVIDGPLCSVSDQIPHRSEMTRRATFGLMHCSKGARLKISPAQPARTGSQESPALLRPPANMVKFSGR